MTITINNDSMIPSLKKILGSLSWISSIKIKKDKKTSKTKDTSPKTDDKTAFFIKNFCGKSTDPRSADEIISDIYSSRINKDETFLENAFK